jgi:PAT family beta-lactamase induction signal transducer AmpG
MPRHPTAPIWLMGLSNATIGLYGGIVYFAIPQLLAARHVPEARIGAITAAALAPTFWSVIFAPILDVRFSRRFYATAFAALAALLIFAAILNLDNPDRLIWIVIAGTVTSLLSTTALGGWFASISTPAQKNTLSAWSTIGSIGGTGLTSLFGGELARNLPQPIAALLLGGLVFAPTAIFLFMPAPGATLDTARRLARDSFGQFTREVGLLFKRREVLIALALFLAPCGSFTLTNFLGGVGSDFHASERFVSLAGGVGGLAPGILACLLFPLLARKLPLTRLYLTVGIVGASFTLALILIPHHPWTFALALLGETFFAAFANAAQCGLEFQVIGQNNPLSATTVTVLTAATQVPVTYMLLLDSRAYAHGGIAASFALDATLGIAFCLLFAVVLYVSRPDSTNEGA